MQTTPPCSYSPQRPPLPQPLHHVGSSLSFFVTGLFAIDCSCSGHISGSAFSCEGSRAPVKVRVKLARFSPADGSLGLRRSWRPEQGRACVLLVTSLVVVHQPKEHRLDASSQPLSPGALLATTTLPADSPGHPLPPRGHRRCWSRTGGGYTTRRFTWRQALARKGPQPG